jgi:heme exporter protein D
VDPNNLLQQPGMAEALNAWICSTVGLGPYTVFILVSYLVTFGVCTLLLLNTIVDERTQRRAVAALEAQGIRRRSDARNSGKSDQ